MAAGRAFRTSGWTLRAAGRTRELGIGTFRAGGGRYCESGRFLRARDRRIHDAARTFRAAERPFQRAVRPSESGEPVFRMTGRRFPTAGWFHRKAARIVGTGAPIPGEAGWICRGEASPLGPRSALTVGLSALTGPSEALRDGMMRRAGDVQDRSADLFDLGTSLQDLTITVHFLPH